MSNNGSNNWSVGYSAIRFFEQVLDNHTAVESFTRYNDIQFSIQRRNGLSPINAVLVDVYVLGEAALYGVREEFPGVTAIVNNGHWNHIAFDWRDLEKRTGVAAFLMPDFIGALNVDNLAKYTPRDERERSRPRRRRSS